MREGSQEEEAQRAPGVPQQAGGQGPFLLPGNSQFTEVKDSGFKVPPRLTALSDWFT